MRVVVTAPGLYVEPYLNFHGIPFTVAVERIFEVSRAGELERYKGCKMDNQRLLFHGTKSSNLLGILSRGLLVTPHEAYWTGRSFGNVCIHLFMYLQNNYIIF